MSQRATSKQHHKPISNLAGPSAPPESGDMTGILSSATHSGPSNLDLSAITHSKKHTQAADSPTEGPGTKGRAGKSGPGKPPAGKSNAAKGAAKQSAKGTAVSGTTHGAKTVQQSGAAGDNSTTLTADDAVTSDNGEGSASNSVRSNAHIAASTSAGQSSVGKAAVALSDVGKDSLSKADAARDTGDGDLGKGTA